MFSRIDADHELKNRQTDRQTDRQN